MFAGNTLRKSLVGKEFERIQKEHCVFINTKMTTHDKNNFQLISDVHLDVRGHEIELDPVAPILVIAGDVCPHIHDKYRDFLLALTENHRYVAYVPGNHEFYGSPVGPNDAMDAMERICKSLPSRVCLLRAGGENGLDVPGSDLRFVGATTWTNIEPVISGTLKQLINDFNQIKATKYRILSPHDMSLMHEVDKKWISDSVRSASNQRKRPVVVTHHSPDRLLSVLNEDKAKSGYGPLYYASDMGSLIKKCDKDGVVAWCFGHTHESHSMLLPHASYPFLTNALGYPGQ